MMPGCFGFLRMWRLFRRWIFLRLLSDDPQAYGQIAAANSLSDVYAMGGRPITALNICGFPSDDVAPEVIAEVLRGAQEKVAESGAVLVGGHSVEDVEPKFGLSVTGVVHPDDVKTNAGARVGDRLILTKPLGTGLLSDAYQNGEIDEGAFADCRRFYGAVESHCSRGDGRI